MPHLVPRTVFRDDDLPEVEAWNENFLPLAQKLSGRINEHDVASGIFAYSNLSSSCYYTGHLVSKSVDPDLTGNDWFLQDGAGPDTTYTFTDSYAWERVRDLVVSLTTGEDQCWVIGQAVHAAWLGLAGTNPTAVPGNTPMRLQYALRVDGLVLDETITGAAIIPDPPPQQLYRVQASTNEFDWRRIQYIQDTVGVNSFAHATRVMAVVPVAPGEHTFEMAARRVPSLRGKVDENGDGVYAQAFSRQLFVVRVKGDSAHTGGVSAPLGAAWEDTDVISQATLGGRLTALRDKINDLGDADLDRGALRHEHLPTTIHYPEVVALNGALFSVTSVYAGYGAAGGWTVIQDGAGNNARTSVAMDFTTYTGVLVVLANVEVYSVVDTVTAENVQAVGVLALRMRNNAGASNVIDGTEVYINAHNPNPCPGITRMEPINDDLPLTWVIDVSTLSAANKLMDYIEIVGATWDGSGAAHAVTMKTRRVTMMKWLFRGATLS